MAEAPIVPRPTLDDWHLQFTDLALERGYKTAEAALRANMKAAGFAGGDCDYAVWLLLNWCTAKGVVGTPEIRAEPEASTNEEHEANGRGAIPPEVYNLLPKSWRHLCQYPRTWYTRDTFLTALIGCLAACLPNVRMRYGGVYLSMHLYFIVLAEAAAGKHEIDRAGRLVEGIDATLAEEHEQVRKKWAAKKDRYEQAKRSKKNTASELLDDPPGPEPPETYLLAADDTTLAALVDALNANEGILIVTTELDGLSKADGRDVGGFSHLLRKAFHHERMAETRRGRERKRIVTQKPRMGLVAGGTPDQFGRFIGNGIKDGLHSRVAVYQFDAPLDDWATQRPRASDVARDQAETDFKAKVKAVWEVLRGREEPLYVDAPTSVWDKVDDEYSELLTQMMLEHGLPSELAAHVKRGAVIAFRIMGTMAVWRAYEDGADLGRADRVTITEADATAGIRLARLYLEHSLRNAASQLKADARHRTLQGASQAQGRYRITDKQRATWEALPTGRFRQSDLAHIHEGARPLCSRSTLNRHLARFVADELLVKDGVYYQKKALENETLRLSALSGAKTANVPKSTSKSPNNENETLRQRRGALVETFGDGDTENGESLKVPKSHGGVLRAVPLVAPGRRVRLPDGREGTVTNQQQGEAVGIYVGVGGSAESVMARRDELEVIA